MHYREIPPLPPLAGYVECVWTLESDTLAPLKAFSNANLQTAATAPPERILPDGCVELILNFGAAFEEHTTDGTARKQPTRFLVGQMTGPVLIAPTGLVELMGIRFHPGGTVPFFRLPMHELTDTLVELRALSSKLEQELLNGVEELRSLSQKVALVQERLLSQMRVASDSLPLDLAAKIVARGGLVTVDELVGDCGISGRQLERRFLQEVGIGPKLLSRILRFQQVFRAVERDDVQWAPIAVECGYYDQSHLIRDFQQFARQSPAVLFAHQSHLTESFTRKLRTV
jgi:AraC-like DNA-binding protein